MAWMASCGSEPVGYRVGVNPWRILAEALGQRLDADLIPTLYAAASVPTPLLRAELRAAGRSFIDAETGSYPEPDELARTVNFVVKGSTRRATAVGAISGVAGVVAWAPEWVAGAVSALRLAQRLAVVHGFDPDTDEGKLLISRALAHAFDVKIPESTRVTTRVSELPALVRREGQTPVAMARWVAGQVASTSVAALASRVVRLVPGLGFAFGGVGAWRRSHRLAARMCEVFARAASGVPFEIHDEVLADEVR